MYYNLVDNCKQVLARDGITDAFISNCKMLLIPIIVRPPTSPKNAADHSYLYCVDIKSKLFTLVDSDIPRSEIKRD